MDCIDLFKRAAMALQTDPRYLALDQARKANDKDEELQNLDRRVQSGPHGSEQRDQQERAQ